jgi:hypothetical protein
MYRLPILLKLRTRRRLLCLMAVAVFFCAVAAVYFTRYLVRPYTGLAVHDTELNARRGGLVFTPQKPDSPATQAGLAAKSDRLLAINGTPLYTIRDFERWESGHYSFEPVVMTVRDPAGAVRIVIVTPQMGVSQNDWFFTLFFIVIMGGLAVYLLAHYHHEITHTLFALLVLNFTAYTAVQPFSSESLFPLVFVNFGELTAWFIVLFIAFFQKDVLSPTLKRIVIGLVAVIVIGFTGFRFTAAVQWFLSGDDSHFGALLLIGRFQNNFDAVAYAVFLFLLGLTYFKTTHRDLKQHIEWITAGALLSLPPHFFFNQLPFLSGLFYTDLAPLGMTSNFFLVFLPLSYVIGLVRARGFRIRVLQSRMVVYIIVAFVLLAFFTLAWQPAYLFVTGVLRLPPPMAGFAVGLTLLMIALYLQLVIFLVVDRRLLREKEFDRNRGSVLLPEFRDRTGTVPGALEYEALVSGLLRRCDLSFERLIHACRETENTAGDPNGETSEAHISGRMRRELVAWETFRKRFTQSLEGRTAMRISFALEPLIESVVRRCRACWTGKDIRVEPGPSLRVLASPDDVGLCLLAVLENACEAVSGREDVITIGMREDERSAFLTVTDRGPGVSLKHLALAGRPFFSTKRDHEGLGLFFTRLILERNGGSLRLEPGEESGTRVILRLPKTGLESAPGAMP